MDILGIGFPELLFIFIIALMIFGPRRLPEVAAKAGKVVRDLRSMSQGFMTEWQREVAVAARLEDLQQVKKELEDTKQALQQTRQEISGQVTQVNQTISATVTPQTSGPVSVSPPAPNEPATEKNGNTPQPQTEVKPASANMLPVETAE
jgi:Tat protein translocase TatB subunit